MPHNFRSRAWLFDDTWQAAEKTYGRHREEGEARRAIQARVDFTLIRQLKFMRCCEMSLGVVPAKAHWR